MKTIELLAKEYVDVRLTVMDNDLVGADDLIGEAMGEAAEREGSRPWVCRRFDSERHVVQIQHDEQQNHVGPACHVPRALSCVSIPRAQSSLLCSRSSP